MAAVRHLLESLFNPFFITFLVFFISLLCFWKGRDKRHASVGFLFFLGFMLILSTGWLPRYITHKLEDQYPIVNKPDPAMEWIVVLSGGQAQKANSPENNLLYSSSLKRLVEGLRLYRQLPSAQLLLSGGGYKEKVPEASRLTTLASWFGIPSNKVILEVESINTNDQAVAIKSKVQNKPFYLVTSAIHMPRAMALCHRQGLNPIAAPTDFTYYWDDERWEKLYIPNPNNLVYMNIAWHEILGKAWARITGQV